MLQVGHICSLTINVFVDNKIADNEKGAEAPFSFTTEPRNQLIFGSSAPLWYFSNISSSEIALILDALPAVPNAS